MAGPARDPNPDVLDEVASRVVSIGAAEFEVEYKDGEEHVVAFNGAVGVAVTSFLSHSEEARALRSQLYALAKKPRQIFYADLKYVLRAKVFDSFGEDAFRVSITKS
jgi:hypothetical protein